MSPTFMKETLSPLASPARGFMVKSVSLLLGFMGFTLSVITAVLYAFSPTLFRQRTKVLRSTSSRRKTRRRSGRKSSVPSTEDGFVSSGSAYLKSSHSLKPSSSEPSFPRGLSPPTNDYFPPMPSWTSDIPQLVVIPSDEDLAFHDLQRKPATSRRIATCSTHKTVRAARSMSFFKSESNGHPTSDKSKHSAMKSGQKQKSLVVRPRTQPYEAPYFLPPPALPPLPQDLRPQLTRARSQTMPPSLQEAP